MQYLTQQVRKRAPRVATRRAVARRARGAARRRRARPSSARARASARESEFRIHPAIRRAAALHFQKNLGSSYRYE